jgi:hypothetical protein
MRAAAINVPSNRSSTLNSLVGEQPKDDQRLHVGMKVAVLLLSGVQLLILGLMGEYPGFV